MIQKTTEILAQTIARVHDEAKKASYLLVFEKVGGGTYRVSGDVQTHTDSVEFIDDEGVHVVVPYNHIISIEARSARG